MCPTLSNGIAVVGMHLLPARTSFFGFCVGIRIPYPFRSTLFRFLSLTLSFPLLVFSVAAGDIASLIARANEFVDATATPGRSPFRARGSALRPSSAGSNVLRPVKPPPHRYLVNSRTLVGCHVPPVTGAAESYQRSLEVGSELPLLFMLTCVPT